MTEFLCGIHLVVIYTDEYGGSHSRRFMKGNNFVCPVCHGYRNWKARED